jgi:hypothetical protein
MTDKINKALDQLNCILPLVKNQDDLSPEDARVHITILNSYAMQGRAPSLGELAVFSKNVSATLANLKKLDLVVLNDNGQVRGAYPFTSEDRIHQVTIGKHTVHCMCALDSLAVSPMFQIPTHIRSRCIVSGVDIDIQQNVDRVLNADDNREVYFVIDWGAANGNVSCADSLCGYMDFIKGDALAKDWQSKSKDYEAFNLAEAIEFATRFFSPLTQSRRAA